jgi:hypothetical protein
LKLVRTLNVQTSLCAGLLLHPAAITQWANQLLEAPMSRPAPMAMPYPVCVSPSAAHEILDPQVRQGGGLLCLLRRLFLDGGRQFNRQAGRQAGGQAHPRGAAPRRPRATMDQVAEVLQKLPAEIYATKADLESMSVHDLKVKTGGLGFGRGWVRER